MAISLVGTNVSNTTTVTIPTHVAGDLIVIFGLRGGSTSAPSAGSGFSTVGTKASSSGGTPVGSRLGFKVATSTTDTSGTWTNATNLVCQVYRASSGVIGIGSFANNTSTTNTVDYPALTLFNNDGTSWIAGFVGVASITETIATAPTGMTNESTTTGTTYAAAGHDTEGGVSSWSDQTVTTTGTAGKSVSWTIEIYNAVPVTTPSQLVQHVGGGSNCYTRGNTGGTSVCPFKLPFPNAVLSGNCLVLGICYDTGLTPTVSDNINGSWGSAVVSASGGAGGNDSAIFIKPNAGAGLTTITVTFGSATRVWSSCRSEFTGIATSSTNAGTISTGADAGSTLTCGSFTPTNNNATGGNLIWSCFFKAEGSNIGATNVTQFTPGGGAALLDADIAWYNGTDDQPHASMCVVQSTSAAINPTIIATGDTDHYNALSIALKLDSTAGTAPASTGIRIVRINHFATLHWTNGANKLQVPAIGNLRVLCSDDPNVALSSLVDNDGSTWSTGTSGTGFWFRPNATSANDKSIATLNATGGSATLSFRYIDIIGADPSPFDSGVANLQAVNNLSSFTVSPSPSPVGSDGLLIGNLGLGQGPGLAVTAPSGAIWDLDTYASSGTPPPGETDLDLLENADIMAHYRYSSSGPVTFTFSITNNASNSTSGGFIAFKNAAGVNVSATPGAASISLSGQTPTANIPISLIPNATSATLTGVAPTSAQNTGISPNPNTSILLPTTPTSILASFFTPNSTSLISSLTTPSSIANTIDSPTVSSLGISGTTPSIVVASYFVPNSLSSILALTTPNTVLNNIDNPDTFSSNFSITTPTVTFAFNFVPNQVTQFGFNLRSPTVDIDYFLIPGVRSSSLTSTTPVLGLVASLSPATASLLISDYYVTEASDFYITENGDYYVTEGGSAPNISFAGSPISLSPVSNSISITGQIPTVAAQTTLLFVPTAAPFDFTTTTSTINQTTRASLVPTVTSLTLATTTSSIVLTTHQSLVPISDSLDLAPAIPNSVLTTNAPLIITSTSALLSGTTPLLSSSLSYNLSPNNASITLTTSTPNISQTNNVSVIPSSTSILLSGYTPSISASNARNLSPSTISVNLASSTPSSVWTNNIGVVPAATSILLSNIQPVISIGFNLSPSVESSILVSTAPIVAQTNSVSLIPNSLLAIFSGTMPIVSASNARNLFPATTSFSLASTTSNIIWTNNIRISPDPTVSLFTNTTPDISETFNFYAAPFTIPFNLVPSVPDFVEFEIVTFRKSSTLASIGTRVGTRQELVE